MVTVNFAINEEIDKELDQLLAIAKEYKSPTTGKKHFKGYDKDQLLQMAMEFGSTHLIMSQLEFVKELLNRGNNQ